MQGHQLHAVAAFFRLAVARVQRCIGEEVHDAVARRVAAEVDITAGVDEFVEVFAPRFGLFAAFCFKRRIEAGVVDDGFQRFF